MVDARGWHVYADPFLPTKIREGPPLLTCWRRTAGRPNCAAPADCGRISWRRIASGSPLVQVAFIRISSNPKIIADAVTPREALAVLKKIVEVPGHHFWPDAVAPTDAKALTSAAYVGHRQVTDAYLLAVAQHHKGRLATFDNGIAELIEVNKERRQHITVLEA
jgi:uncharacterized protein